MRRYAPNGSVRRMAHAEMLFLLIFTIILKIFTTRLAVQRACKNPMFVNMCKHFADCKKKVPLVPGTSCVLWPPVGPVVTPGGEMFKVGMRRVCAKLSYTNHMSVSICLQACRKTAKNKNNEKNVPMRRYAPGMRQICATDIFVVLCASIYAPHFWYAPAVRHPAFATTRNVKK